jgi:hypothetical protein
MFFLRIRDIFGDRIATSPVHLPILLTVPFWVPGVKVILIFKLILVLIDLVIVLRDLWGA